MIIMLMNFVRCIFLHIYLLFIFMSFIIVDTSIALYYTINLYILLFFYFFVRLPIPWSETREVVHPFITVNRPSFCFPVLLSSGRFSHISTKKTTFLLDGLQSAMSDR